jgi:flagellar export protein FliJ
MPVFVFKLEPVLRQRRRDEDSAQRDLAQLLRERFILESQLRSAQQTIHDDKRSIGSGLLGPVDVPRIRQHAMHVGQCSMRARLFAGRLMGLERRIDHARNRLIDCSRARKAAEILEERQRLDWERDQKRRENAALDELAVMAHDRLSREAVT